MIKFALPAAIAALVLGAPVLANAQMAQPVPLTNPTNPMISNTAATAVVTPQGQFGESDGSYQDFRQAAAPADVAPMAAPIPPGEAMPMAAAPMPPGTAWIAGHYRWDASAGNYVWVGAQLAAPPHPNAQWVAGHWQETPTSWIWIDGRWN